ncbi:amidase [Gracilibacillus oryzae]|uniref:Amidase n=1 Tax=Gracilibacillus oryzae TaxID=1672701 RepID=A0A7C8KTA2_9BACI|nr:amidase [Gracilibacillus oryzae]KAB8138257.1 amidase [Gracilibacillus oryzae]
MNDKWQAFVNKDIRIIPEVKGTLSEYTFAVKDVFDIKGNTASAGNPYWRDTHLPAGKTADSITSMTDNGAALVGATLTDELMYSLSGKNHYFGTPINPAAPNRIPGGSSSGSAVAVASGLADFSLGTDTGGSIRIPSSFCGIYGFRPSHDYISMDGVIPLAKSFDTVGVMARSMPVLAKVAALLLHKSPPSSSAFKKVIFPTDVWDLAETPVRQAKKDIELPKLEMREEILAENRLEEWKETFRVIQGYEIWENHGEWIENAKPIFGPGIHDRFLWTKTITEKQIAAARKKRDEILLKMQAELDEETLIVMPTAPSIAPLISDSSDQLQEHREKLLMMTCIAGLNKLPQVTVPWIQYNQAPVGLSFLAANGQDRKLIEFVSQFSGQKF